MIGDTDLSDWTPVEVREGEVAELVLTKEPQGVLTGKVTENGQPLRNARLRLTPEAGGRDKVNAILLSMEAFGDFVSGRGGATATTDRNGRYEFEARDVGTYTLTSATRIGRCRSATR